MSTHEHTVINYISSLIFDLCLPSSNCYCIARRAGTTPKTNAESVVTFIIFMIKFVFFHGCFDKYGKVKRSFKINIIK